MALPLLIAAFLQVTSLQASCPISPAQPGYLLFTDAEHRFCFLYPANYHLVHHHLGDAYFWKGHGKLLEQFESTQVRRAITDDNGKAAIVLQLSAAPFNLQSLIRDAPTGVQSPPSPQHFGALTFYKYGAGGGGVSYDDIIYFNLRGKTLRIVFDGPFDGHSKSPSVHTQQSEKVMLKSFRLF